MVPPVGTLYPVEIDSEENPFSVGPEVVAVKPVVEVVTRLREKLLVPKEVVQSSLPAVACRSNGLMARKNGGTHIECAFSGYCLERRRNGKAVCTHWTPDSLECATESHKYAHPLGDEVYCYKDSFCPNKFPVRREKDLFTCGYLKADDLR